MQTRTRLLIPLTLLCALAAAAQVRADTAALWFNTNSLDQIYNGAPCAVTVTTEPAGLTTLLLYEGETNAPSNAGYYEVTATIIEPGWAGSATNYLAVDRAPQTVLFNLPADAVATSALPLTASSTSGQTPSFGLLEGPGIILDATLFFTNQGTCVLTACVTGNENYRDACTAVTVQVTRATAEITLMFLTQQYDGNPVEPIALTTPDDLDVEITYDGTPTPPVNVGSYAVSASVTDPCWSGTSTGLLTITQGTQLMFFENPGLCARTNTPELIAGTTASFPAEFTVIEGPASIYTNEGLLYAAFSNTGRVSITASHPGNSNWLPAPTVTNTFYVFENPLYIEIDDDIFIYDGTPHPATFLFPDGITSNDLIITYSGSTTPPTDAGDYELVALITNPPPQQGGYIGEFTILMADDVITFDPPEEVIATGRIALAATTLSGRPCLFYAEPDHIVHIDDETNLVFLAAGDAIVCAFVLEDRNWIETESWAWITAAKADLSVNLLHLFQAYDGTPRIVTAQAEAQTVEITYDGAPLPPIAPGRYAIAGTLDNPLYQGSATGTLIVLERPEIILARSNELLQITWPTEPDLYYSVQLAAPNFTAWNDLPPFTNLTGNGFLTVTLPTDTPAANFRIVAYP